MKKLLILLVLVLIANSIFANDDDDLLLLYLPAILSNSTKQEPPPKPTPPPPGVTILPTFTFSRSYFGDVLIIGEIYNNTSSKIRFVEITANIFNGNTLVANDFTFVDRSIMAPRSKSCFKMYTNYSGNFTKIQFEPIQYSMTTEKIPKITLSNLRRQEDYFGDIEIIGFARNAENQSMSYTEVIATFYNNADRVIDCDFGFTNQTTLQPGQSSSFTINTNTPNNQVKNYILQTDALL